MPTGPQFPANPWTVATQPVTASPNGITMGEEDCSFGTISIASPLVTSPTGTYLYVRDAVYTRPESQSGDLNLALDGDAYYQQNGSNGGMPIYLWNDLVTGAVGGQSTLDAWTIQSGYDAAIVQWVWDNGIWYQNAYSMCAF
jgi:hypothetical protein